MNDAAAVLKAAVQALDEAGKVRAHRGGEIDYEYVEKWADRLGLRELLARARGGGI